MNTSLVKAVDVNEWDDCDIVDTIDAKEKAEWVEMWAARMAVAVEVTESDWAAMVAEREEVEKIDAYWEAKKREERKDKEIEERKMEMDDEDYDYEDDDVVSAGCLL